MQSTAGPGARVGIAGGPPLSEWSPAREGASTMAEGARVAVVTGGSRGIGRGIVVELAAAGFAVVVNYRSDSEAAASTCLEAERRGSPRTVAIGADVADVAQAR